MGRALTRPQSLRTMTLADAPDLLTAIAAGEAHGLTPPAALKSAFGKWLTENRVEIERYRIATMGKSRAMVNQTALLRLLTIILVEQGRELATLREDVRTLRKSPQRLAKRSTARG